MDTLPDRLITIVRRSEGLFGLFTRPKCAFRMSLEPKNRKQNLTFEELNHFYEFVEIPLKQISSRIFNLKRPLLRAWERLQSRRLDPEQQLAELTLVTGFSRPGEPGQSEHLNRVLRVLQPYKAEADRILQSKGFTIPKDAHRFGKLPREFQLYILPSLAEASVRIVHEYLRQFWNLSLRKDRNLLAAISRMASYREHDKSFAWFRNIERQWPNRRSVFTTILMESGAFACDLAAVDFAMLDHLETIKERRAYVHRAMFLMRCITKKIKPEKIRMLLQFASPDFIVGEPCEVHSFPEKEVQDIVRFLHGCDGCSAHIGMHLWDTCGKLNGFAEILRRTHFRTVKPSIALEYLYVFIDFALWQDRSDPALREAWRHLQPYASKIWNDLSQIEKKCRKKYLQRVSDLLSDSSNKSIEKHLGGALDLLKKFSDSTWNPDFMTGWTAARYAQSTYPLTDAFLHAPEASWRKFEKMRRADNTGFKELGLERMLKAAKLLAIKSFCHFPNKLFQVAEQIGSLEEGRAKQILSEFTHHPFIRERFGKKSNPEVVRYFQQHKEWINPVPRRLQELADIPGALSVQRMRRYRSILSVNLNLTWLQILEELIPKILTAGPFSTGGRIAENVEHGIRILAGTRENRRAAKRFLRAYLSGDHDYVWKHPRTQKWMKRHDGLEMTLWSKGLPLTQELDGYGPVRIEVEQNPFEAWKLGTYVHSCLALGGINQEYAAAVVLDLNKRVLYARDQAGRVVGRQLIAVSEEGKLVCFAVYPRSAPAPIKAMFRKYDIQFARTLALPLHRNPKELYTIANILSQSWYDDFAWNLK